jgi:Reverse transcriptase (RNA-dependent DNA polymerase)
MKPQDVIVALALVLHEEDSYAKLAKRVRLSGSETHAAVHRLRDARLVGADRTVHRTFFLDFLFHGLRYTFPVRPGGPALGLPTGAGRFEDPALPKPEGDLWVWPSSRGTHRGLAVDPLHPPDIESDDLLRLLAAVDLLRMGRAREVAWAKRFLAGALGAPAGPRLDLTAPSALQQVFTRDRLRATIAKWSNERRVQLGDHPVARQILAEYGDEIADLLCTQVTAYSYRPSPAVTWSARKGDGGERVFSAPALLDAVVARRVVDEMVSALAVDDGGRTFLPRSRTSSLEEPGRYTSGESWRAYLRSLRNAAAETDLAYVSATDIEEFFPSVDLGLARQVLAQRTGAHPDLIALLFECVEAWNPPVGFRRSRGLPIDLHDVSRVIADGFLRTVDDEFEDDFRLRYRRFMDDTVVLVASEEEARRCAARHQQVLRRFGLRQNPAKVRCEPADVYLRWLDPPEWSAALESLHSARLPSLHSKFAKHEHSTAALRRLYGRATAVGAAGIEDQALADLAQPAVARAALRYLQRTGCTPAGLRHLMAWHDAAVDDEDRIVSAEVIAGAPWWAPPQEEDDALAWMEERVRGTRGDSHGLARAALLYGLVRCDRNRAERLVTELIAIDPQADPSFALGLRYVSLALLGPDVVPPPRQMSADVALLERLVLGVLRDALGHPARVLRRCRRGRGQWLVEPSAIPLLVAFSRSTGRAGEAFQRWRGREGGFVDPRLTALLREQRRPAGPSKAGR